MDSTVITDYTNYTLADTIIFPNLFVYRAIAYISAYADHVTYSQSCTVKWPSFNWHDAHLKYAICRINNAHFATSKYSIYKILRTLIALINQEIDTGAYFRK